MTHLLFVDDVLIFLNGGIFDLTSLHNAFGTFQKAMGMVLNEAKSTIIATGCPQHEIQYALRRFFFTVLPLEEGLRYLSYQLKPHGYKIAYWTWLISKVEKRLSVSYHKYLSRAGRLILIKDVLEATPAYWMMLACIPRGILARLQNICCRPLWKGNQPGRIFSWAKWETLVLPKQWGGWGIKRLDVLSKVLVANLGW